MLKCDYNNNMSNVKSCFGKLDFMCSLKIPRISFEIMIFFHDLDMKADVGKKLERIFDFRARFKIKIL